MLRGDEVGALLGSRIAASGQQGVLATSIVSSSLLGKIAERFGLGYQETLTGFKWISKVPDLLFGYEEALGYCVDPAGVRDKDGITAALAIAELAASLKADGRTLLDELAAIDQAYGPHRTDQFSLRVTDLAQIPRMMAALRQDPPKELGGLAVERVDDLSQGTDSLPPTDGLRFVLEGARVVVRPSGTEPKLKCYLEAASTEVLTAVRESLGSVLGEQ
jgi:phosphomannomutase